MVFDAEIKDVGTFYARKFMWEAKEEPSLAKRFEAHILKFLSHPTREYRYKGILLAKVVYVDYAKMFTTKSSHSVSLH